MDFIEHMYLMDETRLLLLLALSGQRHVFAFALPDPGTVPSERWKQAAVEMLKDKWLVYDETGLCPAPDLLSTLQTMSAAEQILAVWNRTGSATVKMLYAGAQMAVLEVYGEKGYRLYRSDMPTLPAFEKALALPHVHNGALHAVPEWAYTVLKEARPMERTAMEWGSNSAATSITELYYRDEDQKQRWVWLQKDQETAVLKQSKAGSILCEDCRDERKLFYNMWTGKEKSV